MLIFRTKQPHSHQQKRDGENTIQCVKTSDLSFSRDNVIATEIPMTSVALSAQVFYISEVDSRGSLVLPVGEHNTKCCQLNPTKIPYPKGIDVILNYIKHDRRDLIHCSDEDVINSADGDQVFAIPSENFKTNKAPKNKPWEELNSYRVITTIQCQVKQRLCKAPKCAPKLRYFRSQQTENVLVQHIGKHSCNPLHSPDGQN